MACLLCLINKDLRPGRRILFHAHITQASSWLMLTFLKKHKITWIHKEKTNRTSVTYTDIHCMFVLLHFKKNLLLLHLTSLNIYSALLLGGSCDSLKKKSVTNSNKHTSLVTSSGVALLPINQYFYFEVVKVFFIKWHDLCFYLEMETWGHFSFLLDMAEFIQVLESSRPLLSKNLQSEKLVFSL